MYAELIADIFGTEKNPYLRKSHWWIKLV